MHPNILSKEQTEILPLIKQFRREFYLVGDTAIGLIMGHRKSIDFDLFKSSGLKEKKILDKIREFKMPYQVTRNVSDQLNVTVNGVKLTFFEYPFPIKTTSDFNGYIKMPDLLTLASMKAYALGRRSKWKDYVDMYFLLKYHFSIKDISTHAPVIFGELFSEKLFRAKLSYFKDIDYSEEVDFMPGFEVSKDEIKDFLHNKAIEF